VQPLQGVEVIISQRAHSVINTPIFSGRSNQGETHVRQGEIRCRDGDGPDRVGVVAGLPA
jgi:hypothetical protein